ncbi:UvrD-helicase domain-containing protein [Brevibacterium casei]|uniref:UvrD-helicase domain-containing protein n=1 Tax=Brevibacterium casei TaxID=33889 RepID=UPI003EF01AFD
MSISVITASAGSGKTYRLTEVLSEKLAGSTDRNGIKASEVIATTFTVRAAGDLIDKTQRRLLDDGNTAAAEEIGTALIGTVNSVAGRIVTDYAIDAGYSPQLRVLDETEQSEVFNAAVDDVIAEAEVTHRDLLVRTGHNGARGESTGFGQGPEVWSDLVKDVVLAARTNRIDAADLRRSAGASVDLFLSALPTSCADHRQGWRDLLARDTDDLRAALRHSRGEALDSDGEPRITVSSRSAANVEGSIVTLDRFLRELDNSAEEVEPFPAIAWSTWAKVADMKFPTAPGGKALGTLPKQLLESSSAKIVREELLANEAFHGDVRALIDLVISTAVAALDAYEEYKDRLGVMDFVDQEVRALELLETNDRVRRSISSRYRLLAVDEFQDSSPIQLAIFMELAELVDEVIWVGDRKQSIYGFRGADPELMNRVFDALTAGRTRLGQATKENLSESWRSSDPPLDLSNAIFRSVFSDDDVEDIVLTVPEKREHLRSSGSRELWVPDTDKGKDSAADSRMVTTIAEGVVDFLGRMPQLLERSVEASDLAILLRTNSQVSRMVAELKARGIPAVGSTTNLLATREGQFVAAGLAAVVDDADEVALVELITLMADHGSHASWFDEAVGIVDREERRAHVRGWWDDPSLAALAELRSRATQYAPVDLLHEVIDALDLPQRIKAWSSPESRLGTLDALSQIAAEFDDAARQTRSPSTPAGLLRHLADAASGFEQSTAQDAVLVTTMHQSKGLQWPVVITGIPIAKTFDHRVVNVATEGEFDALHPLANRTLRLLPRVLKGFGPLREALGRCDVVREGVEAEERETARLLYVALTRAESHSIMAFGYPDGANNILNVSTGTDLLSWDVPQSSNGSSVSAAGDGELRIADLRSRDGGANPQSTMTLPMRVSTFSLPEEINAVGRAAERRSFYARTDIPRRRPVDRTPERVSAHFTASGVDSTGMIAELTEIADLGSPLVERGGQNWDRVGDAVHAYLGLPLGSLDPMRSQWAAERIISRWGAEAAISAETLMEVGHRWIGWLESEFPGAEVLTEQPIAWRNDAGQVMEGWIDTRLVLPSGDHILIDHKSYPGVDPFGHIRDNYLGQLTVYGEALAATIGTAPARTLVHLPLLGSVVEVEGLSLVTAGQ